MLAAARSQAQTPTSQHLLGSDHQETGTKSWYAEPNSVHLLAACSVHAHPGVLLLSMAIHKDLAAYEALRLAACQHVHQRCLASTCGAHQRRQYARLRIACTTI